MVADPIRQNLLPDPVKYPFYQPKYTVVLELKNVLVHPEWDVSFSLFTIIHLWEILVSISAVITSSSDQL